MSDNANDEPAGNDKPLVCGYPDCKYFQQNHSGNHVTTCGYPTCIYFGQKHVGEAPHQYRP
jgi:hypothetical protein